MLETAVRNRALNSNPFPAWLVHPGHGSVAALKAQRMFMNLTVFDGKPTGSVEERSDLMITKQNINANRDHTSKPIQTPHK